LPALVQASTPYFLFQFLLVLDYELHEIMARPVFSMTYGHIHTRLPIDFATAAYLLCAIGVLNSLAKTFNLGVA
jgi:hypothetical protein